MIPPYPSVLIISIILICFDFVYITINRKTFETQIADIQQHSLQVRPESVIACYIVLVFGLYWFIIREKKSIYHAFLLGLVIYAVYDLTSYSLFRKWNVSMAIIDVLWGGSLFAATTYITYQFI
jgi:uncharacterized membrane protein